MAAKYFEHVSQSISIVLSVVSTKLSKARRQVTRVTYTVPMIYASVNPGLFSVAAYIDHCPEDLSFCLDIIYLLSF